MPFHSDSSPSWQPTDDLANPAGYATIAQFLRQRQNDTQPETVALANAAAEILKSPLELRRLTDRVYTLMLNDLRHQQERSGRYGGNLSGENLK